MQDEKNRLRAAIRRHVAALSADERRAASDSIARRVLALAAFCQARAVMLFASMPDEVDTSAIIAGALAAGKRVGLPRCRPGGHELDVIEIADPAADPAPGRYGIPEPVGDCLIPPADLDLVLVPGRAFDRSGNRLGRGAAYYDRFLAGAAARALRCAVCFEGQLLPTVPHDAHDVPVHVIVTDKQVVRIDG